MSLGSSKMVESFLQKLVARIGMRILGSPHVYKEEHGGVSGIAVLSTSHVVIHTQMRKVKEITYGFFVLDLFSCRSFPNESVKDVLTEHFAVSAMSVTDLSESLAFP